MIELAIWIIAAALAIIALPTLIMILIYVVGVVLLAVLWMIDWVLR